MNLKNLINKKIGILGLGLENQALIRHLLKHKIKCEITVCDAQNKEKLGKKYFELKKIEPRRSAPAQIHWQLGRNYNKNLEKFDILFRSPGWPIVETRCGASLQSAIKLFFELCPTKNIIGVTGTKGKGTTASLIYEILKSAGRRVWLGGNIGVAPFDFIDKIKKNDWVVLELSSFQLEDMAVSPKIAVITNFYSEHLAPADPNNQNYHKNIVSYEKAKLNIIKWQQSKDRAVINYELKNKNYEFNTKAKIIYFKKSNLPSKLVGEHNKENVAAAAAVAKVAGVKPEIIKKAVAGFKGLPHRLELARELNGIKYYDDSFATTPESAIIAIKSFAAPIVLLLGGAEKKSNFRDLAKQTKKRVKFVVLLKGDATLRIKKELLRAGFRAEKMQFADNIKTAVNLARAAANRGDIVLLSTACASFGMFKNYKERGDLFKKEVKKIKK